MRTVRRAVATGLVILNLISGAPEAFVLCPDDALTKTHRSTVEDREIKLIFRRSTGQYRIVPLSTIGYYCHEGLAGDARLKG